MTNEVSYAPIKYVCNGLSVDFAFPWKIFQAEDLIVTIQGQEGVLTLELEKDFTVEFDDVGGNVKTNKAWPDGTILVVARNTDDYQSKDFTTSTGFQASEIEKAFDRVSCNLQEMDYNIENFKETFSKQVGEEIDELENVIEENKQEVLVIQERFEDEVNTKIEAVSEAAGKINALEQAVLDAQASADNAQASADEALAQKEDLIIQGEKLVEDVSKEVARVEDAVEELDKNIDKVVNHSQYNMFDMIITDHILEGKEAINKVLQGTYVYKNGGTNRTGYPDFYSTCLEEYQNSTAQSLTVPWTQPVATGETTAIDGGDMVITASSYEGSYYPYLAFDGNHSTSTGMWSANSKSSGWWQIKFPYQIKITGLTFYQKYSSGNYFTKDARFYTSSDMSTPIGDAFVGASSNYYATEIQNIPAGGVITDTIYLNITSTYSTNVGMSDLKITAEKVIGEVSKNNNGHRFYPISLKSSIDEIYNTYGIADFYGIDEENERIFLPRNKWFAIKGSVATVPVFGNGKTLGMMDGSKTTGLVSLAGLSGVTDQGTLRGVGVAGTNIGTGASTSNPLSNQYVGVTTDPSLSGLIADTSNVVQPDENKYLYYCVGNTQVTSAVTNVTEITTSENDTLPWGYNFYSGDLLEAPVGYVQSQGQWNRGQEWQSFYDRAVAKIGQPFADGYIKAHTEEYNDFDLVINQDEMTFRLPLLNGEENIVSDKYEDWELLPSVSNYEAPANGMIQLTKRAGTADAYITMWSDLNGQQLNNSCPTSGGSVSATMELTKGETFNVGYSASGDTVRFRFIYFKGNGNLYFKLANAVQNLELLNVGEVMNGLAQKADTNLDNVNPSQNFKEQSITWGIPDYTAGVSRTANVEYIAECAGYISGYISGSNKTLDIYINGNRIIHTGGGGTDIVMYHAQAFVNKGDTYKLTDANYTFYPLKGTK